MAIVKMKRLHLIALRSDQEELLRLLQRLGCVEISQPEQTQDHDSGLASPDSGALLAARNSAAALQTALDTLRKAAKPKGGLLTPRPVISEREFFDDGTYAAGLDYAQAINHAQRQVSALYAQQSKLKTQKLALAPWLPLDVPLDVTSTREVEFLLGTLPARVPLEQAISAVADASELAQIVPGVSDSEAHHVLVVCHKSAWEAVNGVLKEFGFTPAGLKGWTGTAAENDRRLDAELKEVTLALEAEQSAILAHAEHLPVLERTLDRAMQDVSREEARGRLLDSQQAFCMDGWFPAEQEGELSRLLESFPCAWEAADPTEEEIPEVPVKLKNNLITRSMNTITEMYSLPAYDGIDPNPVMAPFFIVFFGMIMADMGYGLLMVAASALVLLKKKPKNPNFMEMIFWCGISTIIWGAMSGGFFGDMIPQLVTMINPNSTFEMPALFTALDDIVAIMVGSLILGVIQVITGMTISVIKKTKDGNFIDALFNEISWWIILAGLALFICGKLVAGVPAAVGTVGLVLLIVGGLMLAGGGTREAKGFGKVTSLVGIVYNGVTGFFSDILSYIRLMALMVSGSVIASVFNTLGATTGIIPVFILISLLGNALNLALSLLGAYVHDLRLQCLEFFGRFYKEGGKPYQPLSIDTQYVDIIKEEN